MQYWRRKSGRQLENLTWDTINPRAFVGCHRSHQILNLQERWQPSGEYLETDLAIGLEGVALLLQVP